MFRYPDIGFTVLRFIVVRVIGFTLEFMVVGLAFLV